MAMTAQQLAHLWHNTCEVLGPEHNIYILKWDELPEDQKKHKIAVAEDVLRTLRKQNIKC